MSPLVAVATAAGIAVIGWRARALTTGGGAAATVVGSVMLWATGWPGVAILGAFFVPTSAVSRLGERREGSDLGAKGSQRDAWQVLANGGAAALAATLEWSKPGLGTWTATAALAAAASDTWATSLGALSRRPPRDILQGHPVPPGASGGVTWVGSGAGMLGAVLVSGVGALVTRRPVLGLVGVVIGVVAMLLDSVLGAAAQGKFECDGCLVSTERRVHGCGRPARLIRGWRWLDNDGVNAVATVAAGLAAVGWWRLCSGS